MTRNDYLNHKVTHEDYYSSIAKAAGVSFKSSSVETLRKLKAAWDRGDESFNSIPLSYWDRLAIAAKVSTHTALLAHGDYWSLAGGVCIAKQAAREAVKEFKE